MNLFSANGIMSGLAIFGMKFSSLLQFEENKSEKEIRHNLKLFFLDRVSKSCKNLYTISQKNEI